MPLISIIVPCYNEEATIRLLLDAILRQSTPTHELEVIIADGLSQDGTRAEVAAFQKQHPALPVVIVDNPRRHIPTALNCALSAARGTIIIRLDAHSVPAPDYVERCVSDLQASKGDNVGGVWQIRPLGKGIIARSIAIAAAHPFGVGDARYRYSNQAGAVDTVPFGAFRRETFERIGRFDETLLTNEDYEFNARIRQGGGIIWFDPGIHSTYFARATLGALAKQYARYGFWKYRMLRKNLRTLRWRQALPPLFVLSVLIGVVAAILWPFGRVWALRGLGLELALYALVLIAGALPAVRRERHLGLLVMIPMAIAVMHTAWGGGFLFSAAAGFLHRKPA